MMSCTTDAEHGFSRKEMYSEALAGSAKVTFARHVFVAWGRAAEWPAEIPDGCPEGSLPRIVAAAVKEAAADSKEKVKLTFVEVCDDAREGDVLIFPDYVRLRVSVEDKAKDLITLLRKSAPSPGQRPSRSSGDVEDLAGGFAFVCSHTQRDARCGHCGPELHAAFTEVAQKQSESTAPLSVLKCSHVGGHKFAGNVIMFSSSCRERTDDGHWYGYVTPTDVPRIVSGEAMRSALWRGRLGLTVAEAQRQRRVKQASDLLPVLAAGAALAVALAVAIRSRRTSR